MVGEGIFGLFKGGMIIKFWVVKILISGGCVMVIIEGFILNLLKVFENGVNVMWFIVKGIL